MEQYSISINDNTLEDIVEVWCSLSKGTPAYNWDKAYIVNDYFREMYLKYKYSNSNKYFRVNSDGHMSVYDEDDINFNVYPEAHKVFKLKRRVA